MRGDPLKKKLPHTWAAKGDEGFLTTFLKAFPHGTYIARYW